jgi:hypothetical protein
MVTQRKRRIENMKREGQAPSQLSLRLDARAFDDLSFDGVVVRKDSCEVRPVAIYRFLARLSDRLLKSLWT